MPAVVSARQRDIDRKLHLIVSQEPGRLLLGHGSVRITERHYAPRVGARQDGSMPIYSEHGQKIRPPFLKRRVHQRCTGNMNPSTDCKRRGLMWCPGWDSYYERR